MLCSRVLFVSVLFFHIFIPYNSGRHPLATDKYGRYFLDCNPDVFEQILECLRSPGDLSESFQSLGPDGKILVDYFALTFFLSITVPSHFSQSVFLVLPFNPSWQNGIQIGRHPESKS